MKNALQIHIKNEFPFLQKHKVLVAVSGGLDSMVLVHLLQELKYNFANHPLNFK